MIDSNSIYVTAMRAIAQTSLSLVRSVNCFGLVVGPNNDCRTNPQQIKPVEFEQVLIVSHFRVSYDGQTLHVKLV